MRVVLDTNCLISALLFSGRLSALRAAWVNKKFTPLMCPETTNELIRVLAYPKFKLTEIEINNVLSEILPFIEVVTNVKKQKVFQQLQDPDDAIFLHLSITAQANILVSGDIHLLAMKNSIPELTIMNPSEFIMFLQ